MVLCGGVFIANSYRVKRLSVPIDITKLTKAFTANQKHYNTPVHYHH